MGCPVLKNLPKHVRVYAVRRAFIPVQVDPVFFAGHHAAGS
jgi:hypothetical protein